mgnify:FL=1|jgi:30S ribosomal protein S31
MGRGDRRSRKGKIFRGSYGNSRPHREPRLATSRAPVVAAAPAKLSRAKKPAK